MLTGKIADKKNEVLLLNKLFKEFKLSQKENEDQYTRKFDLIIESLKRSAQLSKEDLKLLKENDQNKGKIR